MSDKEAKKPTVAELEKQLEETQKRMSEIVAVTNAYIKAHRDLILQLRTLADTGSNLEALLAEKLK
jgi:hypothetical protein